MLLSWSTYHLKLEDSEGAIILNKNNNVYHSMAIKDKTLNVSFYKKCFVVGWVYIRSNAFFLQENEDAVERVKMKETHSRRYNNSANEMEVECVWK